MANPKRVATPGVEIYLAATDGCGWSDAEYATWLADLLVSQLLTSGHAPG